MLCGQAEKTQQDGTKLLKPHLCLVCVVRLVDQAAHEGGVKRVKRVKGGGWVGTETRVGTHLPGAAAAAHGHVMLEFLEDPVSGPSPGSTTRYIHQMRHRKYYPTCINFVCVHVIFHFVLDI